MHDLEPTCHVIMGRLHYSLSEFRFEMQWWLLLLNQKTKTYRRVLNNEGLDDDAKQWN